MYFLLVFLFITMKDLKKMQLLYIYMIENNVSIRNLFEIIIVVAFKPRVIG